MSTEIQQTIGEVTVFAKTAPYNSERRAQFRSIARKFLTKIAINLDYPSGGCFRYNAGGIAGSGDAILHTDRIYVHINDFGCYYRTVKGKKDYTGGPNNTPRPEWTAEEFAENINALIHRNLATF